MGIRSYEFKPTGRINLTLETAVIPEFTRDKQV